jgi:FixJ family two-component response regulator
MLSVSGGPVAERPRADEATVYVVDDDAGVRRPAKELIETVGLRVETFASAQGPR